MKRKPSENKTKNSSKKQKQASQEVELEQGQQGIVAPKNGDGLALSEGASFVQEWDSFKYGLLSEGEIFVEEGDICSELGRHEEAIVLYQKALKLNQNSSMILYKLGASYDESGQPEAALTANTKAIELDRTNTKFFSELGRAYFSLKQYQEAIAPYIKATELDQTNAKFFNDLGDTYFKLELGEEAIAPYIKATELESTNAKFFNDLGNAYFYSDQGLDKEAIASYIKAIELEPTNAEFFSDLGTAYFTSSDLNEEAIASYIKATELDPTNARFFRELGTAYSSLDLDKEAIASYIKATKLEPANVSYFKTLGNAYFEVGQYLLAFKSYLKAVEVAGNDRGEVWRSNREIGDAITKLTEYTHIDKFKLTQLAMEYYGKGGEWGEKRIFDSITSSKPLPGFMQTSLTSNTPESPTKLAGLPALLALGYSCFSKGEYTKALDAFDLFLKHEKQFDVFVNAEVAAGEILKLNQNAIRESIFQTKSLKESINLRTNQDQHILDFLSHMKKEYHLSATEFLPQVVNELIRGLKHNHASIPDILNIILSYIIEEETLESIQAPGRILKLFGESPTIEIEELTAPEEPEIEVAGEAA